MIRYKSSGIIILLFTLANACSSVKKEEVISEKLNNFVPDTTIHLNNGKKWKVETKMLGFIRQIETLTCNDEEILTIKDYKQKAGLVKVHLDSLTSNCVMEGRAHDELHAWLLPYIDLVDSLNNSTDTVSANLLYTDLKNRFKDFNYYFE